jgi:ribosomal protein S18 acetylase RimI-like enzyme
MNDTTLKIKQINNENDFTGGLTRERFIEFLYRHIDQFGDSRQAISNSIDYAFSDAESKGGFLLAGYDGNNLIGVLVMIDTGMKEYISEHLLVYVAVDGKYRGKGYGKKIIEYSLEQCGGNVSLHVEYENPAKRLYERIGFESKYAEMRYMR